MARRRTPQKVVVDTSDAQIGAPSQNVGYGTYLGQVLSVNTRDDGTIVWRWELLDIMAVHPDVELDVDEVIGGQWPQYYNERQEWLLKLHCAGLEPPWQVYDEDWKFRADEALGQRAVLEIARNEYPRDSGEYRPSLRRVRSLEYRVVEPGQYLVEVTDDTDVVTDDRGQQQFWLRVKVVGGDYAGALLEEEYTLPGAAGIVANIGAGFGLEDTAREGWAIDPELWWGQRGLAVVRYDPYWSENFQVLRPQIHYVLSADAAVDDDDMEFFED